MPIETQKSGYYRFGAYCLDIAGRCLSRCDELVHLTPKTFDVLLVLVQHHGRLVDKKFLMETVWPDVAVEEGNLTFTINILRKVLVGQTGSHVFIKNVRGRGYIFVPETEYIEEKPLVEDSFRSTTSLKHPL